jgi:hypothetical protein
MAEWRPLHQSLYLRSGLEAGGQSYDPPLLPYEKSLIAALDCSEEEYKKFVRYAKQRAHVRPAEYAHIPDIKAEVVTLAGIALTTATGAKTTAGVIVANLAIGLALTAVSLLLAPKVPSLEDSKIKSKKLKNQIGPSSFNQATSFDNAPSLAELNQPIPIPFGKRGTGADGVLTGGLVFVPALVWSRLYAYGAYQAYEGVYVAGEFGVDAPELGAVLLGTQSLSALGSRDFALYWSSKKGNNRPASPVLLGTEGPGATGTVGRQVFTAPTEDGQFSEGFSMSYVPSGDTTFGTGTPIHNGSAYRFNWEIVSAPFSATEGSENKEAREEIQAKRRKIAGSLADVLHIENEEAGQPGVGRAYSRHMGFIKHNNVQYENKTIVTVSQGDEAIFEIDFNNSKWEDLAKKDHKNGFKDTEVNLDDLVNEANSWRERASDLMVIGSRWIIGASSWIVKDRVEHKTDEDRLHIHMECVAILGVPEIGIAGTRAVREPLGGYEGDVFNPNKHCGAAFYNVCRLNVATIRPVRRDAEVIELGIRSQVFNRAAGLCNFNSLPSPSKLFKLDEKNITLTTGRMDKYFQRSSCFSIWVRPVAEYGQTQAPFKRMPQVFCVQGSAPIAQNNYLRIRPRVQGFYEYRLIPRTGSDIAINSINENEVIVLQSSVGVPYNIGDPGTIGIDNETPYGNFRVTVQGKRTTIAEIKTNDELFTKPGKSIAKSTPTTIPATISNYYFGSDTGSVQLIKQAWLTHFLGNAKASENRGKTVTVSHRHYKPNGNRFITVTITATSVQGVLGQTIGPKYQAANNGRNEIWSNVQFGTTEATGNWAVGDAFTITANVDNIFSRYAASIGAGYSSVGFAFSVASVTTIGVGGIKDGERVFEQASQVSDCSHYTQLTKSNDSGPEHEIVYVNEYISNESLAQYDDMSTIGLTLKSTGEISGVEQLRIWSGTGIPVTRLIEGDNKPSNLFADLVFYLLKNKSQGVGNVVPAELVDEDSLRATARFLRANKIFYDGVIEDSESFRTFIYDNAPLQLCSFTIKNGRFGMIPALPVDSNDQISLQPITVEQIFTAGNIIENSLQLQYIDVSQRSNIRALVTWRVTVNNDLPYQASALMHWSDFGVNERNTTEQSFDLSEFCTNREQALRTARFLLSVRRRITKTVSFKTVPDALGVQPGSYIRVITEASTYSSTANGSITNAGTLVSITTVEDGDYEALLYNPTTQEVTETTITIANNAVSDSQYHGSLFTLLSGSTDYSVYQIESLNLEEDGLVSISAVEVPTDASGVSIVAKDVLTPGNFTVLE